MMTEARRIRPVARESFAVKPLTLALMTAWLAAAGGAALAADAAGQTGATPAPEASPAPGVSPHPGPSVKAAPVVVTATRSERSSFDLPVSIDVVDSTSISEAQPMINAAESLVRVPGLVAPNQYRLSSDQQLSSRGFGARASFGIRGIRVYADGIPQTMPDGQGQSGTFSLSSADRMEVMRGPFSALYGNSAGGVVQIFTRDASAAPTVTGSYYVGDFDTYRAGLQAGGQFGMVNALVDASRYKTDGFRDHSRAQRDQVNAKFVVRPGGDDKVTLVVNDLDQPYNKDPQGLTRAQMETNPQQAAATAVQFDTGGYKNQTHAGLNWEHRVNDRNAFSAMVYAGEREVQGKLGFTGSGATSAGGISLINRDFLGTDLRWQHTAPLASGPLMVTGGVSFDTMEDARKGFVNNFGVVGALKRDEINTAENFDQYLQAEWQLGKDWVLNGGVRRSEVKLESDDNFVTGANPDDSGSVKFTNTSPVLGVLYHLTPAVNVYANYGRGFETPSLIEIAYRVGGDGPNFGLQPSKSRHVEAGVKAVVGAQTSLNAAVFRAETENEIVVAENNNGRATYKNAGRTSRQGVELAIASGLAQGLDAYASLAYLDAKFDDVFISGTSTPVPAGNQIPGAPHATAYAELAWRLPSIGMSTAVEARYTSRIYINDANTDAADASTVVNWRLAFRQSMDRVTLSEFARLENVFDEKYVGGVNVNDGNGRYFAPAPGRNLLLGVSLSASF